MAILSAVCYIGATFVYKFPGGVIGKFHKLNTQVYR